MSDERTVVVPLKVIARPLRRLLAMSDVVTVWAGLKPNWRDLPPGIGAIQYKKFFWGLGEAYEGNLQAISTLMFAAVVDAMYAQAGDQDLEGRTWTARTTVLHNVVGETFTSPLEDSTLYWEYRETE